MLYAALGYENCRPAPPLESIGPQPNFLDSQAAENISSGKKILNWAQKKTPLSIKKNQILFSIS